MKISSILVAFVMLQGVFVSQAQTKKDVTIETYGIYGQGRPTDASKYYFLQSEGADLAAIKVSTANTGGSINVVRDGEFVYFTLEGTDKYLKFTNVQNQVKWVSGKDENAKWKEVAAIQKTAPSTWKSYVLASKPTLFLRHASYVMFAEAREENQVFYGDATWQIAGGEVVVKPGTPNATAYGNKYIGTHSVNYQDAKNYFIGINSGGKCQIIDITKPESGTVSLFEVRYKETMKVAVLVDSKTGKFVTADASGNISMTADEQPGSFWTVTAPLKADGLPWFSLKSNHPSLTNSYLRHQDFFLYAWAEDHSNSDEHFKEAATWNFATKNPISCEGEDAVKKYQPSMKLGDKLQENEKLMSANGRFQLRWTLDGNFILEELQSNSNCPFKEIYRFPLPSGSNDKPATSFLRYGTDGNVCFISKQGKYYCATDGLDAVTPIIIYKSEKLELTDDGRLRLVNSNGQEIYAIYPKR